VALTPFEAMCGFRRIEEISALLKKHPEFAACVSAEAKLKVGACARMKEKEEGQVRIPESTKSWVDG
jgi:mannose-6-phosphate isomerase